MKVKKLFFFSFVLASAALVQHGAKPHLVYLSIGLHVPIKQPGYRPAW